MLVLPLVYFMATSDSTTTLHNVRSLLRPGGHLILQKATDPGSAMANLDLGFLERWWLNNEEWRKASHSPLLSVPQRHQLLDQTGLLSGAELTIRDDGREKGHFSSIIVLRAVDGTESQGKHAFAQGNKLVVLIDPTSNAQCAVAAELSRRYSDSRVRHVDELLQGNRPWNDAIVICIFDVGKSYLSLVPKSEFRGLQRMVQVATKVLWVTQPPQIHHQVEADAHGLSPQDSRAAFGPRRAASTS